MAIYNHSVRVHVSFFRVILRGRVVDCLLEGAVSATTSLSTISTFGVLSECTFPVGCFRFFGIAWPPSLFKAPLSTDLASSSVTDFSLDGVSGFGIGFAPDIPAVFLVRAMNRRFLQPSPPPQPLFVVLVLRKTGFPVKTAQWVCGMLQIRKRWDAFGFVWGFPEKLGIWVTPKRKELDDLGGWVDVHRKTRDLNIFGTVLVVFIFSPKYQGYGKTGTVLGWEEWWDDINIVKDHYRLRLWRVLKLN